jgi:hypothetical protein
MARVLLGAVLVIADTVLGALAGYAAVWLLYENSYAFLGVRFYLVRYGEGLGADAVGFFLLLEMILLGMTGGAACTLWRVGLPQAGGWISVVGGGLVAFTAGMAFRGPENGRISFFAIPFFLSVSLVVGGLLLILDSATSSRCRGWL